MYLKAKALLTRVLKTSLWVWVMLCLILIGVFQLHTHHLDDRLYYWFKTSMHAADWQEQSVWLPAYRVEIDAKPITEINNNLSGLTFDPDLNLLWAVINGPNELLALSTEGDIRARYTLDGFDDVEALAYLGNGQLIVAEERKQNLVIVSIPMNDDGTPQASGAMRYGEYPSITLALWNEDNKGIEGLAYDLKNDRLYVAKERDPIQLLEVSGIQASLETGLSVQVRNLSDWVKDNVFATDLSSATFDQNSGHLILLSDESKLLMEMTVEGQVISFRSLSRSFAGLRRGIPQAEGVSIDENGHLYVVSEPNLFYRFTPDANQ